MKWRSEKIGDFCRTGSGGTPSRKKMSQYYSGTIPWVKSGELRESIITSTEESITDIALKETSAKLIPSGALLVAMYGATIGRIAILGIEATSNQAVCHIIPDLNIADRRYLFYALRQQVSGWLEQSVGGAQPNINQQIIKETKIPIPPLEEQKRIAAILDKADRVRRKRQEAIRLTEELGRSIFLDMFGDPVENPKKWLTMPFGELCTTRLGKMLDKQKQTGEFRRMYLRNANVQWFGFDLTDVFEMNFNSSECKILRLQLGDLLIYEGGEPGRAAIWRDEIEECYYQKTLHRARPNNDLVNSEYLAHLFWFLSKHGGLNIHITSSTISHLTGEKLKAMSIPVPKFSLQKEFSQRINMTEKVNVKNRESFNHFDALFNSLLQRAFRGEL